jgi:hypothetical protein
LIVLTLASGIIPLELELLLRTLVCALFEHAPLLTELLPITGMNIMNLEQFLTNQRHYILVIAISDTSNIPTTLHKFYYWNL